MGRRLILDTNVLVDYERDRLDRRQFDNDDIVMAAISVAEFRAGAERASTTLRRAARLTALADLRDWVDVADYTESTAVEHAKLLAHTHRTGRPRGPHDLIIAAHAAETGRTIVSRDAAARFGDLPDVAATAPE
ncbi:hypothetical protein GCM10027062_45440 [Nocardioides hungaricus]|jgi:predicted nucleic acid-binding protein